MLSTSRSQYILGMTCSQGYNPCTVGEICNADKECVGDSTLDCDDGNPCTADSCDPDDGTCSNEVSELLDGVPCVPTDRGSPNDSGLSLAIAWMSSQGIDISWGDTSGVNWKKYLYSELWAMSADGTGQTQLTHFNDPGYDEYKDGVRTIVSDSTWSPDGRSLAVLVAYDSPQGMRSELAIIELE